MNGRIFELSKQVDLIQWELLSSGARTPEHESVVKAKKFAELIVADCILAVERTPLGYGDYRDQILESMRNSCARSIKEHFGVE